MDSNSQENHDKAEYYGDRLNQTMNNIVWNNGL